MKIQSPRVIHCFFLLLRNAAMVYNNLSAEEKIYQLM